MKHFNGDRIFEIRPLGFKFICYKHTKYNSLFIILVLMNLFFNLSILYLFYGYGMYCLLMIDNNPIRPSSIPFHPIPSETFFSEISLICFAYKSLKVSKASNQHQGRGSKAFDIF